MLRSLQLERLAPVSPASLMRRALRPACICAIMFLMMRTELLMRASPLAAALLAASLAAGENAAAPVIGCLLGMLRLPVSDISLLPVFSCAIVLLCELMQALAPKTKIASDDMRAAFTAGLAAMLPNMIHAAGDAILSLSAFACGALAAAAAPFLRAALQLSYNRKRLIPAEKTGLMLMLGGCIAGMQALYPPIADAGAVLCVLLLPGFAPASGICAGLALLAGGADIAKMASLCLIALACGKNTMNERWQRSLAVCAAAMLASLAIGPGAADIRWVLCAAALYPLLPPAMVRRLDEISSPHRETLCDPEAIAHATTDDARRRLNALAEAFSVMAETHAEAPDVPDEQALMQEMRLRLCTGCIQYGACWAGESNRAVHLLCRLISDSLERIDAPPGTRILFSDGEIPPDVLRICRRGRMIPDRLGLLLRDFAQKRRSGIKRCQTNHILSAQFMQAQQILLDMARESAPSPHSDRLHAALEGAGLGFCCTMPLQRGGIALLKDEAWSRDEIRRACSAASRSLCARFLPRTDGAALHLHPAARLHAEAHACCQSGVAGETCGDSHMIRPLDEGRLMLAISDGMGSGEAAALESGDALRLLWRFLDAGISRALALETVNRQLLLRSGEEIFATIDLCIIDLNAGIAEMTKLAACRSLILRGDEILRIEGGHLPLGILENVGSGMHRLRLKPGDLLVMGSDGVMEGSDALLPERLIRENGNLPPDALCRLLVRQAGLSRADGRQDDLTCICVRIRDARDAI